MAKIPYVLVQISAKEIDWPKKIEKPTSQWILIQVSQSQISAHYALCRRSYCQKLSFWGMVSIDWNSSMGKHCQKEEFRADRRDFLVITAKKKKKNGQNDNFTFTWSTGSSKSLQVIMTFLDGNITQKLAFLSISKFMLASTESWSQRL